MMTCEEILSIEEYCAEHKVSHRKRLEELDIPFWSLFSSCKAHEIDVRTWLEDILKRIPTEKDINLLLPSNWQPLAVNGSK